MTLDLDPSGYLQFDVLIKFRVTDRHTTRQKTGHMSTSCNLQIKNNKKQDTNFKFDNNDWFIVQTNNSLKLTRNEQELIETGWIKWKQHNYFNSKCFGKKWERSQVPYAFSTWKMMVSAKGHGPMVQHYCHRILYWARHYSQYRRPILEFAIYLDSNLNLDSGFGFAHHWS